MSDNTTTWALVPIKNFTRAKSRLSAALNAEQCAQLATCMAADVTTALRNCTKIGHVVCLGEDPLIRAFSAEHGCEFIAELEGAGLSANLDHAARQLESNGAQTLLIIPGDLPTITTTDLDTLLKEHSGGLTICPADRDGGTNALVISPPTGIGFLFGEQSCERHVQAAQAAGLNHRIICPAAFQCDIDRPTDLAQLCNINPTGHTGRYLDRSGLRGAFSQLLLAART
ncbi:MAG TPA: 2-phospho-L-lactate guanylyltransferase [Gammaproteobacteria bacterium]|nr:2-phospho-L-lactate guanylyltransferase [Chromatiales bacterium]MCP4925303.1 2-phospho-L-lactate guanylyltransferase [Gammaproteobacteria bacterium]MDP7296510.1 2-phospho-L-lactate guanylyltransferase [Gammaproteobacteria bacterium]MDP7660780.1 2-phospho-L-lactate guanylyltransferase [Gammaproteobacteria bacterium]HJP37740.1 2-phospho-L-lactate guanylyltransferase [Gammaproteobacteria bacterium]